MNRNVLASMEGSMPAATGGPAVLEALDLTDVVASSSLQDW
jgi:hypothetical protein